MANTKELLKSKRKPRTTQRPRKETVTTAKTITQADMITNTTMNTSPMIDAIRRFVKEMIMITHNMNTWVMATTVTKNILVTMIDDMSRQEPWQGM
jgi:hypothetical protein